MPLSSNPIVLKLSQKNAVVKGIKCFTQVAEDANCTFVFTESSLNCLQEVQRGMGSIASFSKAILGFEKYVVSDQEVENLVVYKFFQDF